MSLTSLDNNIYNLTLDGLVSIDANQINIDGNSINPTAYVTYSSASNNVDLGSHSLNASALQIGGLDVQGMLNAKLNIVDASNIYATRTSISNLISSATLSSALSAYDTSITASSKFLTITGASSIYATITSTSLLVSSSTLNSVLTSYDTSTTSNSKFLTITSGSSLVSSATLNSALTSYDTSTTSNSKFLTITSGSNLVSSVTLNSALTSYDTSITSNSKFLTITSGSSLVSSSTLASTLLFYDTTATSNSKFLTITSGSSLVSSTTLSSTLSNYPTTSTMTSTLASYVPLSGATVTGPIYYSGGISTSTQLATKAYVDANTVGGLTSNNNVWTGTNTFQNTLTQTQYFNRSYDMQGINSLSWFASVDGPSLFTASTNCTISTPSTGVYRATWGSGASPMYMTYNFPTNLIGQYVIFRMRVRTHVVKSGLPIFSVYLGGSGGTGSLVYASPTIQIDFTEFTFAFKVPTVNMEIQAITINGWATYIEWDTFQLYQPLMNNQVLRVGRDNHVGYASDSTTLGLERSRNVIIFPGYRDTISYKVGAKICGINKQTFSSTTSRELIQSTDIAFCTTPPETTGIDNSIERMRICDNGNIGIGKSAPESTLDVQGQFRVSDVGQDTHLVMTNWVAGNFASIEAINKLNTIKRPICFQAWGGFVGIGTTNPSAKLTIEDNSDYSYITHKNSKSTGYIAIAMGNDSTYGVIFKNGSARTADGGADTMTVRNDGGNLRLANNGSTEIILSGTSDYKKILMGNLEINPYYGSLSFNDWLYVRSNLGLYWNNYYRSLTTPEAQSNPYGTVCVNQTGRNGWAGYSIGSKCSFMSNGSGFGIHNNTDTWTLYNDGGANRIHMFSAGNGGMTWYKNNKPSANVGPSSWAETGCHVFCNSQDFSNSMPGVGIASFSNAYGGGLISLAPGVQWNWMIYAGAYHEFQTYGTTSTYVANTGFYYASDSRGKHSVKDLKTSRSLERILKSRTVQYKKLHDPENELVPDDEREAVHIGFIAQEQLDVNPHCVKSFAQKKNKPGMKFKHPNIDPTATIHDLSNNVVSSADDSLEIGEDRYAVNYGDYVIHLVGAVQELHKRNEQQQKEIDELKEYIKQQNDLLHQIVEKLK